MVTIRIVGLGIVGFVALCFAACSVPDYPVDYGGSVGPCMQLGSACISDADCCNGAFCPPTAGVCCYQSGNPCATPGDCCSSSCTSGFCD